ncbi:MAG: MBL fold metallo-hydrolase [Propionibacteriaceae bacterium]
MTPRFQNTDPSPTVDMTLRDGLSATWRMLFHAGRRKPCERLPELRPDWDTLRAGGFRFVWFGHSTLALRVDDLTILVDPVLSTAASPVPWLVRRFQPAAATFESLPDIDVVVISHDHYDHLDRALLRHLATRSTARFVVPQGIGKLVVRWGVPSDRVTELGWDEFVQVSTVTFTATESHHSSGRWLHDQDTTLWASWCLRGQDVSVFYTGDSGYGDHWRQIGQKHGPFDIVFAENGQYDEGWPGAHMFPPQTVAAVQDVRGALFVPVHWGMFDLSLHHWSEPVRMSSVEADKAGVPMLTPRIGQVAGLDTPTTRWWHELDARDPRVSAS